MNSRDILTNFLTDAPFSEVCTAEKFSRECASSLTPEAALKLYSLIAEQHQNALEEVKSNVIKGGYLENLCEIGKHAGLTADSLQNPATILYLMLCLTDAVEKGEVQSELLSKEISERLIEAEKHKAKFLDLVSGFEYPDTETGPSTLELAEKCISILRREGEQKK